MLLVGFYSYKDTERKQFTSQHPRPCQTVMGSPGRADLSPLGMTTGDEQGNKSRRCAPSTFLSVHVYICSDTRMPTPPSCDSSIRIAPAGTAHHINLATCDLVGC